MCYRRILKITRLLLLLCASAAYSTHSDEFPLTLRKNHGGL